MLGDLRGRYGCVDVGKAVVGWQSTLLGTVEGAAVRVRGHTKLRLSQEGSEFALALL